MLTASDLSANIILLPDSMPKITFCDRPQAIMLSTTLKSLLESHGHLKNILVTINGYDPLDH